MHRNHYVEPDEITDADVVIVATGGLPSTAVGVPGDDLALDSWDLLAGAVARPVTCSSTTITAATRPSTPSRR